MKFYINKQYIGRYDDSGIHSDCVHNAAIISAVINNLNLKNIGLSVDVFSQNYHHLIKGYDIGLPKRLRCHSKKRFVKLLMAEGESKKMADVFANMMLAMNKIHSKHHKDGKAISWQSMYFSRLFNYGKIRLEEK